MSGEVIPQLPRSESPQAEAAYGDYLRVVGFVLGNHLGLFDTQLRNIAGKVYDIHEVPVEADLVDVVSPLYRSSSESESSSDLQKYSGISARRAQGFHFEEFRGGKLAEDVRVEQFDPLRTDETTEIVLQTIREGRRTSAEVGTLQAENHTSHLPVRRPSALLDTPIVSAQKLVQVNEELDELNRIIDGGSAEPPTDVPVTKRETNRGGHYARGLREEEAESILPAINEVIASGNITEKYLIFLEAARDEIQAHGIKGRYDEKTIKHIPADLRSLVAFSKGQATASIGEPEKKTGAAISLRIDTAIKTTASARSSGGVRRPH